jgi:hypothetical protein
MLIEWVPAGELHKHPANPRQGNLSAIKESIAINGWHGVVVAQRSSGAILAGNHRTEGALLIFAEGWSSEDGGIVVQPGEVPGMDVDVDGNLLFPVHYRDVDDDQALRILLMDNRTGDLATYDEPQLLQLLLQIEQGGELRDLDADEAMLGTGYTPADTEQLRMGLEVNPVEPWNNTPEHNLERYLATDLRQLTVIMESAEFGPVVDALLLIQQREELETNKDVFLFLLKLDPAGAELDARIGEARAAAEDTATANGDAQEATPDGEAVSEDGQPPEDA